VTVSGAAAGASTISTLGITVAGRNGTNNSLRYYQCADLAAAGLVVCADHARAH